MALTRDDIKNLLLANNIYDESIDSIFVTTGYEGLILVFSKNYIGKMSITGLGNLSGHIEILPRNVIKSIEFRKRLLGYKIVIVDTDLVKHSFRVRPVLFGFPEQSKSIENIRTNLI